ncbi:band 4.1-like protein 3 isoform X1 [Haemorhous mexicanus]|uniref:band 4.1-like protein 3 isoform X1 n=1 Tax=Haemorhous mexicanus TaxID=30427 RepID=UPI0028BD7812|nr:band 4.1-like protein 3 isoform X1 [Haemorhous mexicanus]XP_059714463.1 band 4.1-like protein 3 isoform X1 [Haemorhous mexicanus]XP_059714471.1 band 4.1-like protein 3 isoform X1 [Haemorhous mexicanus]XP_059714480.1 band 4.1-like protein 3 isoform X1 [Haemorhous mexicanus]
MTTESGSDSESKDKEQDQEESPAQEGAAETQPQEQQPQPPQQPSEEPQTALEQFSAVAAHSTPVRKEQATEKEQEFAAASAKQLEYQQLEDDKLSQKSSSSKLSKSPLKIVKKPKNMQCKVTLLDGSEYACEVEKRSRGQVLFDKVCEHLNLLEKDYFGLTYRDTENQKNWLDPAKEIKKQIRSGAWQFAFNVKFYPPDPAQLSEDITRYYLCLQLRDDIVSGRLPCSFVTLALLGSYTVQSELGDYDPDEYGSDYISEFRFAPNHTKELEDKVIELHKSHRGMTPAEAEMHFLENAKKLSMYGVDLHHAKDSEGVEIMLGVCASGLLIYRDRLRINRFAWPKVLKISYKRNNFYIKIRPGEFEQFESTIGFKLPNHRAAKRLWKVCVEHHTFFRLLLPEAPPKKFLTLGSKFRYSGRTQAQTRRASALIDRPAPYFERSSSKRYTMSRSLDGASVNENHEMYMKDSVSAAEVGTGQYATTKGISQTNLITTVTPEKKTEEDKDDEEGKKKRAEEVTPISAIRHDTKTDSEQTDTAADGETTATESDQEEDGDLKAQNSLIKRIQGENVYVKHSNLMLEDLDKTQEDLMKHQTNISELKRTFLETSTETTVSNEWEKRLSTSPVRLAARQEDAPMIEPLVPEETKEETEKSEKLIFLQKGGTTFLEMQPSVIEKKLQEGESAGTLVTSHQIIIQKSIPSSLETKQSTSEKTLDGSDIFTLIESARKPTEFIGGVTSTSHTWAQRIDTTTSQEITSSDMKQAVQPDQDTVQKVVQETVVVKERHGLEVHAGGDPAKVAGLTLDAQAEAASAVAAGVKGKEGSAGTEGAKEEKREEAGKALTKQEGVAAAASCEQAEEHRTTVQLSESLERKPHFESPVVKTETISFSSVPAAGETLEISTKEVPVVHTETKTITYESSQVDCSADSEPGVLMSAQTITSETTSTTTTTHITKTVKGGISETRIEKRIVITGDADIDHDQALAQAIKEAKEQHPDMSVTKVVVHKETEITPEDGED